jgi:hypothetical protein
MTGTPRRRHRQASGIQLGTGNTLTTNYRPSRGPLPEALACSVWSPLSRRQALPCPPGVLAVREGQSGHEHRWTGPQIQPTKHVEATHGVTRRTGTRHRCERQQGDYAQLARREDALALAPATAGSLSEASHDLLLAQPTLLGSGGLPWSAR